MLLKHWIVILSIFLTSVSADVSEYRAIAEKFLSYKQSSKQITSYKVLQENNISVAYVFNLANDGYIVMPIDRKYSPVKAYSFQNNFDGLPAPYKNYLSKELQPVIQAKSRTQTAQKSDSRISQRWTFLENYQVSMMQKSSAPYVPDTHLLTTTWDQTAPYNDKFPVIQDIYGDDMRALTGCVQTAMAQLMRYHQHPARGVGVATHTWNGEEVRAILYKNYNWDDMPSTLKISTPQYMKDEVGYLMRDLGIVNKSYFVDGETWAPDPFSEFFIYFGYSTNINWLTRNTSNYSQFIDVIKQEIDALRPILLGFPGHLTVADGYSEDPTGSYVHVNMGWGGHSDDFYNLDEDVVAFSTFNTDNLDMVYNIKPCSQVNGDCYTYTDVSAPSAPVIDMEIPDQIITGETRILINALDANGDTITLRAFSNSDLNTSFENNVLVLTPNVSKGATRVVLEAASNNQVAMKEFIVLISDQEVFFGKAFTVSGVFDTQEDFDKHEVLLSGQCNISGYRGYSNQAFYSSVMDEENNYIVDMNDTEIDYFFSTDKYLLGVSLKQNPGGFGSYYSYNPDYAAYTMSVTCPSSDISIMDIANILNIDLSNIDNFSTTQTVDPAIIMYLLS